MNLYNASQVHKEIIQSAMAVIGLGILITQNEISLDRQQGTILSIFLTCIFLYTNYLFYKLATELDKNKWGWLAISFFGSFLFLISWGILVAVSNRAFKKQGWKVKFKGGAIDPNNPSSKINSDIKPKPIVVFITLALTMWGMFLMRDIAREIYIFRTDTASNILYFIFTLNFFALFYFTQKGNGHHILVEFIKLKVERLKLEKQIKILQLQNPNHQSNRD